MITKNYTFLLSFSVLLSIGIYICNPPKDPEGQYYRQVDDY